MFTDRKGDGRLKFEAELSIRSHMAVQWTTSIRKMHLASVQSEGKTETRGFPVLSSAIHSCFLCWSCLLLQFCRLMSSLCVSPPSEREGINF